MKIKKQTYNLLRWSQKYTKTDMVYLARGGFWLTLKRAIHTITAFGVAMAFANWFPKETYGQYKYILSVVGILTIFTLNGLNTSILRSVSRGFEGSIKRALKIKIQWGILGSIGSLGIAGYYLINGNQILALSFFITTFFIPISKPFDIFNNFLLGRKLFSLSAKYETAIQSISVIALVSAIYLSNNIIVILLTYFLSYTILRFLFYNITFKKFTLNKDKEPGTISLGKHLSLMSILDTVAGKIDSVLMWHFLGPVALAVYSFAYIPTKQIRALIKSTGLLALIKISEKDPKKIKKSLPKKALKFFIILIPIVVLLIVITPYIYKIFFPQYTEAIIYAQFFALNLLFFPKILFGGILTAHASKRALYFFHISSASINIILLIILLPLYGIWGAVATTLGVQVYKTVAAIWMSQKI